MSEQSQMSIDHACILLSEYQPELSFGLKEIASYYPAIKTGEDMETDDARIRLHFIPGAKGANVSSCLSDITVRYASKSDAFRSLGRILGCAPEIENLAWNESLQFDTLGALIDCSRGAVPTVEAIMELVRYMALMGMNTLQLYMEDTYEIEEEEVFGLFRGGYTHQELRSIDKYAWEFGIEVWPCIQVLGHLGQVLQWPQYENIRNTGEVLLVGLEETYNFIDKMIDAVCSVFSSKRLHLGMDEAIGIGEGRYKTLFQSKDAAQIFTDHVSKVNDLCLRKGVIPLIWSDMIFACTGNNYSLDGYYQASAPDGIASRIPSNVGLVYWDYYHSKIEDYAKKIKDHRNIGFEPWVAGGIWTWNRLITSLPFTFESSKALLNACKSLQVKNVFVTVWGDDGNEYDFFSILPGLQFFSEHGYTSNTEIDEKLMRNNFAGVCGGLLDDWVLASKLDIIDSETYHDPFPSNISKCILWQDPIYGLFEVQYKNIELGVYYDQIYQKLKVACMHQTDVYPLNSRLEFPKLLALVIRDKVFLRRHILNAYNSNDPRAGISHVLKTLVTPLRNNFDLLWKHHRDQIWLSSYKPFGLEILELRYGAIRTRLETLNDRLEKFINGSIESLSEFSYSKPLKEIYPGKGSNLLFNFSRYYSPSRNLGSG